MYGMSGELSPMYGKTAWNNGLTTKTDPRLRAAGEKISNIIADKLVSGQWIHPMGFKSGWHDSPKAGRQFHRSSYEKRYFELLDSDPDVVTYKSEPFKLSYVWEDEVKNYVPDVLVERCGKTQLVEVKPANLVGEPKTIAKADAGRAWCVSNEAEYVVVTEDDLR